MKRHQNPARASRGQQYQSATLTEGHFDSATVKVAAKIAKRARQQGAYLGRGNFGEVYGIEGHVVKYPVLRDIHDRPRSPAEARGYLLHEAGVANELAEAGHRIVPVTVFVELPDGTPALVREYGEPLSKVAADEVVALEKGLYDVEATGKHGWDVADELLVMRRKDGTLFVADVGWWRVRQKPRSGWAGASLLPDLLGRWAVSAGLPKTTKKGLAINFAAKMDYLLGEIAILETEEHPDDYENWGEDLGPELAGQIAQRIESGLAVPDDVIDLLIRVERALERKGITIAVDTTPDLLRKLKRRTRIRRRRTQRDLQELRAAR